MNNKKQVRMEHNLPERRIPLDIAYALVRHVQLREERKQHLNAANRIECAVNGMRDDGLDVLLERCEIIDIIKRYILYYII